MDATHYKWYTYESCSRLLGENGFVVRRRIADGSAPLGPLRKWLPSGVCRTFDAAFARTFPGLFGYQLIYVATSDERPSPEPDPR
jgi:hypothetical protein